MLFISKALIKRNSSQRMPRDMMNSKQSSIRPLGQRSITTTFPFRASNHSGDECRKLIKPPTRKCSNLSLSDFLNRKLHKSPVLPTSVPGKRWAFSSPLTGGEDLNTDVIGEICGNNGGETKTTPSLDGVFHMFKNVKKKEKDLTDSNSSNEVESFGMNDSQQVRKRNNLCEGYEHKESGRKRLIVLGEDSKPIHSIKKTDFAKKKEPKPLFNHYKSGGGWWDENMEGLDNEEVGCKDAWEGVGCTTLGAFEWH